MHEQIPAGAEVQWIDTDPGDNLLDFNTATGDADVHDRRRRDDVYFDNEPIPPAGTAASRSARTTGDGWYDRTSAGTFNFTVTDAAGATVRAAVLAGQCSEPIQVAAGVTTIDEHATARHRRSIDVVAFPEDRLLTVNLINRTSPSRCLSPTARTTRRRCTSLNEAQRGQLKVCKALGPGSADLIGKTF